MASKRVATSAIDWASFAQKIPAAQRASFNALKNKQEGFVRSIAALPETLPKIDFANYKSKISNKAMVDEFQKKYEALNIAYPKDTANTLAAIDSQLSTEKNNYEKFVSESNDKIAVLNEEKGKWEAMMPLTEMTREEALEQVPWLVIDVKNPTHWPHTEKDIFNIDLEARRQEEMNKKAEN